MIDWSISLILNGIRYQSARAAHRGVVIIRLAKDVATVESQIERDTYCPLTTVRLCILFRMSR